MNQGYLLIVEDVPDILRLLEETLKFKGYNAVTARNGQEALDLIQRERPALVITDIMMPKLDGFGLVHRLRINPETRDLPVIFLTATYVALEDKANIAGEVKIQFMISPTGVVQSSTGAGFDGTVAGCVANVIGTIAFPAIKSGTPVTVNYPFIFRTAGRG